MSKRSESMPVDSRVSRHSKTEERSPGMQHSESLVERNTMVDGVLESPKALSSMAKAMISTLGRTNPVLPTSNTWDGDDLDSSQPSQKVEKT